MKVRKRPKEVISTRLNYRTVHVINKNAKERGIPISDWFKDAIKAEVIRLNLHKERNDDISTNGEESIS